MRSNRMRFQGGRGLWHEVARRFCRAAGRASGCKLCGCTGGGRRGRLGLVALASARRAIVYA